MDSFSKVDLLFVCSYFLHKNKYRYLYPISFCNAEVIKKFVQVRCDGSFKHDFLTIHDKVKELVSYNEDMESLN
jgi:hypothetical protein